LEHFADVGKTIDMPKGATRTIDELMLSRYACYLIVPKGNPRKEIIAQVMTLGSGPYKLTKSLKKHSQNFQRENQTKSSLKKSYADNPVI
jgi:hypothetical protein